MKFNKKRNVPSIKFEGSIEKRKVERRRQNFILNNRMLVIISFVSFFMVVLIVKLVDIQLNSQDLYQLKLDKYGVTVHVQEAMRGTIEDRDGVMLLNNNTSINAVYYPVSNSNSEHASLIANFLYENVSFDVNDITERQKKDYFIIGFTDIVNESITDEQKETIKNAENYNTAYYQLQLANVTTELMDEYMDDETLIKTMLKYKINTTTSGSTVLATDLSVTEASVIGNNSFMLTGVQVQTDWERNKVFESSFSGVLGRLTTSQQGLPYESKDELVSLGLQNNSRYGTSGLESQYDSLLRGVDSTYTYLKDENGNYYTNTVNAGSSGTNLVLSIDWELQQFADDLLEETLLANTNNNLFNELYAILIDPNTGEIISMSGKQINRETNVITDYADGNYKSAFLMGSTVKGGTMYSAYKNDIVEPGEVINDTYIKIKDTQIKKSWTTLGYVNDITALARSSNVYMFHMAIRLGGGTYVEDGTLNLDPAAFDVFRNDLGELGLGVKTGIDVPEESLGFRGSYDNRTPGLLLDFSIGQYDSYTPIQMAQYISTIANGGQRVQPTLVSEGYVTDSTGQKVTVFKNNTTILDDVSYEEIAFERIQLGFESCVTSSNGTCASAFRGKTYNVSAKTGTAQVFDYSTGSAVNYSNLAAVGYAGGDSGTQIAYVVIAPRKNSGGTPNAIASQLLDKYFEKYGIN